MTIYGWGAHRPADGDSSGRIRACAVIQYRGRKHRSRDERGDPSSSGRTPVSPDQVAKSAALAGPNAARYRVTSATGSGAGQTGRPSHVATGLSRGSPPLPQIPRGGTCTVGSGASAAKVSGSAAQPGQRSANRARSSAAVHGARPATAPAARPGGRAPRAPVGGPGAAAAGGPAAPGSAPSGRAPGRRSRTRPTG